LAEKMEALENANKEVRWHSVKWTLELSFNSVHHLHQLK
jgi:hypothetical protein